MWDRTPVYLTDEVRQFLAELMKRYLVAHRENKNCIKICPSSADWHLCIEAKAALETVSDHRTARKELEEKWKNATPITAKQAQAMTQNRILALAERLKDERRFILAYFYDKIAQRAKNGCTTCATRPIIDDLTNSRLISCGGPWSEWSYADVAQALELEREFVSNGYGWEALPLSSGEESHTISWAPMTDADKVKETTPCT